MGPLAVRGPRRPAGASGASHIRRPRSMEVTSEQKRPMTDSLPEITCDDFARRFALRAANLTWLLGAGVSASSGLPTASDMIWEFKQRLYVSQRRTRPQAVADLASPAIRTQLQSHIDSSGSLPAAGHADEYATLFEVAYPAEADRRTYLDAKLTGAKPSYGHLALATLMKATLTRLVWTTNFDPLIADACAKVFDSTADLSTVDLDAPDLARQLIGDGRWPIEIKLHGDFRSRRLKNTSDELRQQDARLRQVLVDSCRRHGLIVAGYSGRDDSVMAALEEALAGSTSYPAGLFWLVRHDDPLMSGVRRLISRATELGVEASIVRIDNFDELMRDLLRQLPDLDTSALEAFASDRRRWTPAPRPTGGSGWPVVRLNGLPVDVPSTCRRVVCNVGGHAEARDAVAHAGVDVIVSRIHAGVLAFGRDADIRAAFDAHAITEFDLHTIDKRRLRHESGERSLLRGALCRALARERALNVIHRQGADLLTPADVTARSWSPLKKLVGEITGTLDGGLRWNEGVALRMEWAADRPWIVIDPRIVFVDLTPAQKAMATDFSRERSVKRYNRQLNDLIGFWSTLLAGDGGDLRALHIGDGVDAVFRLGAQTCFSRRATP